MSETVIITDDNGGDNDEGVAAQAFADIARDEADDAEQAAAEAEIVAEQADSAAVVATDSADAAEDAASAAAAAAVDAEIASDTATLTLAEFNAGIDRLARALAGNTSQEETTETLVTEGSPADQDQNVTEVPPSETHPWFRPFRARKG